MQARTASVACLVFLNDAPHAVGLRVQRDALIHDVRGGVEQRAVRQVGVPWCTTFKSEMLRELLGSSHSPPSIRSHSFCNRHLVPMVHQALSTGKCSLTNSHQRVQVIELGVKTGQVQRPQQQRMTQAAPVIQPQSAVHQ